MIRVVEKASGAPLSNLRVAIRKRVAITDGRGYATFHYVPHGRYDLKLLIGSRELKVPLTVSEGRYAMSVNIILAECRECGHLWVEVEGEAGREYGCPRCNTSQMWRDDTLYRLKPDEAFCYDFSRDWAWWWGLGCPDCGDEARLEFESGRWLCSRCRRYVEPRHGYSRFRCILPCGHEHAYLIAYLTEGIPLRCKTCGSEARLPRLLFGLPRYISYDVHWISL
jgi:ribosomal protein L37AE/L43A